MTPNCFRTDGEGLKHEFPEGNIDVAELLAFGSEDRDISFFVAQEVLLFLSKIEEIRTDRLHMMIAGALLGKKVRFYANNYYKCKEVYEYSVRDRYPNVSWEGNP